MKKYYATHLVKSEDLNHHGTLFAARTASWFVESAFIAAACEHGDPSEIVCRNIHGMSFRTGTQRLRGPFYQPRRPHRLHQPDGPCRGLG